MASAAAIATTLDHAGQLVAPRPSNRVVSILADLAGGLGLVICVPFAIMAIGLPVVFVVRVLLWIVGML